MSTLVVTTNWWHRSSWVISTVIEKQEWILELSFGNAGPRRWNCRNNLRKSFLAASAERNSAQEKVALCAPECFPWSTWHSAAACVVPFFRSKFRVATSTSISGMSVVAVGWWLVLGHSDQQIWSSETNDARDGNIWRLPPRFYRPRFQTTTYNSEPSKLPCWRCQLFVSCKVRKTCISQTLKLQSENHLVILELVVVDALLPWE